MKKILFAIALSTSAIGSSFAATTAVQSPKDTHTEERVESKHGARDFGPGRGLPEKMTREEVLRRAGEQFDLADANKDGVVTREEFHQLKEKQRLGMPRHERSDNDTPRKPRGFGPDGARGEPGQREPAPKLLN